MAKKRFTEGLESIFGDSEKKTKPLTLFPEEQVEIEVRPKKSRDGNSGTSKRFANKLDAFLAEAFEEVEKEEKGNDADKKEDSSEQMPRPRRKMRRGSGLDILIRNTRTTPAPTEEAPEPNTKRLTVVIERDQLDKLKEIARRKKVYLKDIIGDLVQEYISEEDKEDT